MSHPNAPKEWPTIGEQPDGGWTFMLPASFPGNVLKDEELETPTSEDVRNLAGRTFELFGQLLVKAASMDPEKQDILLGRINSELDVFEAGLKELNQDG